jgi:hypothetical protein
MVVEAPPELTVAQAHMVGSIADSNAWPTELSYRGNDSRVGPRAAGEAGDDTISQDGPAGGRGRRLC